jgi:hypothetical protein
MEKPLRQPIPAREIVVKIPEQNTRNNKPVPEPVIDAIIELKLQGMTEKDIAKELGYERQTIRLHWNRYLRERQAQRVQNTENSFTELIERLNQNALDARSSFYSTFENAPSVAQKFLTTERQALDSLARLGVERDDEPARAARIQAANASLFASIVREVVSRLDLPHNEKAKIVAAFALSLREIESDPEVIVIGDSDE